MLKRQKLYENSQMIMGILQKNQVTIINSYGSPKNKEFNIFKFLHEKPFDQPVIRYEVLILE